ncbi:HAMP domain-containing protein [Erythrobacteraceae bacterium CFH 75059]|uniref:sensor histidine kinase n=1 Tax=Qipengyuania thermophila TaxID=2509361 RepID=UPI00101F6021|nr:stimulus-sensing domain-containing protein [Qipengyuania thermophila]TCD02274.1 HAMP domain-containing protein [Erythrobacteraceae bacterium CFH 75059]
MTDAAPAAPRAAMRRDPLRDRIRWSPRLSLTGRILIVNVLPLALLGGGLIFVDIYRKQLLTERFKLALIEAQITAEALAGASPERQQALLIQIGKEQRLRLRLFARDGSLKYDSFALAPPSFRLAPRAQPGSAEAFSRALDKAFDTLVGAPPLPDYREPADPHARAWPELRRARSDSLTQIVLRDAPDGTHIITAATPVGLDGETLLTTRNPVDITRSVRLARQRVLLVVLGAVVLSTLLAWFLARTIVLPLRELVQAAIRVRQGRERLVEVPRFVHRGDEIGLLARAVSDMSSALRQRIDAVESFAADVAHEIKNPLASLRSAVESLERVKDPDLARQLLEIAHHDVRRIDRLVTDISEASRVDAELSRATFEPVSLTRLAAAVLASREDRHENGTVTIVLEAAPGEHIVQGVPARLERVINNLLDNAVSFSPPHGTVEVTIASEGGRTSLTVSDHGPGIPPQARDKVFKRFHSLRPEGEAFGNHSGLGLAIGRTIAEAHDGTLTAHERADGEPGASLRLELPSAMRKMRE